MKSLLHCVWTGPSFPYALKIFIINWVTCFRRSQSNFQLVLWTTKDSYNELTKYLKQGIGNHIDILNWSKCIPGIDIEFNIVTISGCKFYIAEVDELLTKCPYSLKSVIKVCKQHRRFTTISNIARVLALDHCGGIYTDIDYLTPRDDGYFPKSLKELIDVFASCSTIDFYLPVISSKSRVLIENQCMILPPERIGSLTPLLDKMAHDVARDADVIMDEAHEYATFLDNAKAKELNKSMFTDGFFRELLMAYKNRDYTAFKNANADIFKHEYMYKFIRRGGIAITDYRPILTDGGLHESYQVTSEDTYSIVGEFFYQHLNRRSFPLQLKEDELSAEYSRIFWIRFKQFFNTEDMDQQFSFKDQAGDFQGMYSWANPGYSRLQQLEKSVKFIEDRYIKKCLNKQILEDYIAELEKAGKSNNEEVMASFLAFLADKIHKLPRDFLTKKIVRRYLREIYAIAFMKTRSKGSGIKDMTVTAINRPQFIPLKKHIDPEKDILIFDDLNIFTTC